MRRAHSLFFAMAACLPLAGCYYDPDYGYVRNGSGADTYYGEETTVVSPGYDPGYRYYDYGPGCCYSNVTVGTVWYDGDGRRRYDRRDHDWHGHPPPRGDWHDRDGDHGRPGGWQGAHRPGDWHGGRGNDGRPDQRPPNGGPVGDRPTHGWQGGDRPPGAWHGGRPDGDHRPPSAGSRPAPTREPGTGRDRSRFRSGTD